MTLRQSIARRAEFVAGLIDAAVFFIEHPALDELFADGVTVELPYKARSKAEADAIIATFAPAARPFWRNGVYMAELEPAKLPLPPGWCRLLPQGLRSKLPADDELLASDGEPRAVFEMHFFPPITEQDVA